MSRSINKPPLDTVWSIVVHDLMTTAKMTQSQIAEEVQVRQATISDMLRGQTRSTNYVLGQRLKELHKKRVGRRRNDDVFLKLAA